MRDQHPASRDVAHWFAERQPWCEADHPQDSWMVDQPQGGPPAHRVAGEYHLGAGARCDLVDERAQVGDGVCAVVIPSLLSESEAANYYASLSEPAPERNAKQLYAQHG